MRTSNFFLKYTVLFSFFAFSWIYGKNDKPEKSKKDYDVILRADTFYGEIGFFDDNNGDDPSDNIFYVTINNKINPTDEVYLAYEVLGVKNISSISRSINNSYFFGGYYQKYDTVWHQYIEPINPKILKKGRNSIVFNATRSMYPYKIKNVKIYIRHHQVSNDDKVVLSINEVLSYKTKVYIRGYVKNNLRIDLSQISSYNIYVDGSPIYFNGIEFEGIINKNSKVIEITKGDEVLFRQNLNIRIAEEAEKYNEYIKPSSFYYRDFKAFSGGTLKSFGASLSIGDSALVKDERIYIKKLRSIDVMPLNPGMISVSECAFRFLPDGIQFNKPVLLKIPYDENKLPKGYSYKDIRTFYFDIKQKKWIMLPIKEVDTQNKVVISYTTHFTDYLNGIVKVPESPQTVAYKPTSMSDIKAANPLEGVEFISPPQVNQKGELNTSVPIKIPSGLNGMQPHLAIQYSSNRTNGPLGLGWSLPISSIDIDTRWGTPKFDSQKETEIYLLDGKPLMYPKIYDSISQAWVDYMPNRHHGIEPYISTNLQDRNFAFSNNIKIFTLRNQDPTIKIERIGNSPQNYYWKVTMGNGVVKWYGGDENGLNEDYIVKSDSGNIVKWGLYKTIDRFGNYVLYEYENDIIPYILNPDDKNKNLEFGHYFRIKKITYTKNDNDPQRHTYFIKFEYDVDKECFSNPLDDDDVLDDDNGLRNSNNINEGCELRPDITISFRKQLKEVLFYRLKEIIVGYNNGSNVEELKKYLLSYHDLPFERKSILTFIQITKNGEVINNYDFNYSRLSELLIFSSKLTIENPLSVNTFISNRNFSVSPLRTSVGFFGQLSGRVGLGVEFLNTDFKSPYDNIKAGLNLSYSKGVTAGASSFVDIDGDGLKDIVFQFGTNLYYLKHLPDHSFSSRIRIEGVNLMSLVINETIQFLDPGLSYDVMAGIGPFYIFFNKSKSNSRSLSKIFFTDANNDGLVDISYEGTVLFNHLNSNNQPTFSPSSRETENVILVADTDIIESTADAEYQEQKKDLEYDVVRVWVAKGDGQIHIKDTISTNISHRSDTLIYTIETNGRVLGNYLFTRSQSKYIVNQTLSVEKNQMIFFRLHTNFEHQEKYDLNTNPTIEFYPANNNGVEIFNYDDDFTLSSQIPYTFPVSDQDQEYFYSSHKLFYPENTGKLYAQIVLSIEQQDGSMSEQTLYEQWIAPSQGGVLNIPGRSFTIPAQALGSIQFRLIHETNFDIDWSEVVWHPIIWERTNSDPRLITIAVPYFNIQTYMQWSESQQKEFAIFGSMYNGWGQFAYNKKFDNDNRGAINPNTLFTTMSNLEQISVFSNITDYQNDSSPDNFYQDNGIDLDSTDDSAENLEALSGGSMNASAFPPVLYLFPDKSAFRTLVQDPTTMLTQNGLGKWWGGFDCQSLRTSMRPSTLDLEQFSDHQSVLSQLMDVEVDANYGMYSTEIKSLGRSKTKNYGAGIIGITVSRTNSDTGNDFGFNKTYSVFSDYNGDGYPDIFADGRVQFTNMTGGFHGVSRIINNSHFSSSGSYSVSESFNLSWAFLKIANFLGANLENTDMGNPVANIGISSSPDGNSYDKTMWLDVNGDGLPDLLSMDNETDIHLNFGKGLSIDEDAYKFYQFERNSFKPGLSLSYGMNFSPPTTSKFPGNFTIGHGLSYQQSKMKTTFVDINADGLVDIVKIYPGRITVKFNLGNKFSDNEYTIFDPSCSMGITSYTTSASVYGSINAYFPVLSVLGINVMVGGTASLSLSFNLTESKISFTDFNGDSFNDIVIYDKNNNQIAIYFNPLSQIGYLYDIHSNIGPDYNVYYDQTKPTYNDPHTRNIVTTISVRNPFPVYDNNQILDGSTIFVTKYDFKDPYYDRREREFYGFHIVQKTDLKSNGEAYRSYISFYNNRNYFLKGALTRELLIKGEDTLSSNALYSEKINTYQIYSVDQNGLIDLGSPQNDNYDVGGFEGRRQGAVLLKRTETRIYEFGSDYISSIEEMEYDNRGRVVRYDFNNVDAHSSFSSIISYPDVSESEIANIWSVAKSITVKNHVGDVVRKREMTQWNPYTGTINEIKTYLDNNHIAVVNMEYDPTEYGNLTRIIYPENENGQRMFYEYQYDSQTHKFVTHIRDAFGYESSSTYDPRFDVITRNIDISGNVIEYVYDSIGRLIEVYGPNEVGTNQPTLRMDYYLSPGHLPSNVLDYYMSNRGILFYPVAVTHHFDPQHPENTMDTYTFVNYMGRVVQIKKDIQVEDEEMMSVSGMEAIDEFGRVIKKRDLVAEPKGVINYFVNTNVSNIFSTMEYDELDRVIRSVDPANHIMEINYYIGNAPNNIQTQVQYTRIQQNNNSWIEQYAYTDIQKRKWATVQIGDNDEMITQFNYDDIGQLIFYEDADGVITSYKYDMAGRVVYKESPNFGFVQTVYDNAGNVIKTQTANLAEHQQWINFEYEFNRLVASIFPSTPYGQNISNVIYRYGNPGSGNQTGRLIYIQDATGWQEFSYDKLGNPEEIDRYVITPTSEIYHFKENFSYDTWGRLLSMVYPDGEEVIYSYDLGGNIKSIKGDMVYLANVNYDIFGNKIMIEYGNGTEMRYNYDNVLHRLEKMNVSKNQLYLSLNYKYDYIGNILSIINEAEPASNFMLGKYKHTYSYDKYNRLINASGNFYGEEKIQELGRNDYRAGYESNFKYTPAGDILLKNQTHYRNDEMVEENSYQNEYFYNDRTHRLKKVMDSNSGRIMEISYDNNGNTTEIINEFQNREQKLFWDESNRLRVVTGSEFQHYLYSAQGERILKANSKEIEIYSNGQTDYENIIITNYVIYPSAHLVVDGASYTKHYFMGSSRIATQVGQESSEIFLVGNNSSRETQEHKKNFMQKARILRERQKKDLENILKKSNIKIKFEHIQSMNPSENKNLSRPSLQVYFYHPDHLGTATLLTDIEGNPYQFYLNLPYGEELASQKAEGNYNTRYKFNGKELDAETGLYYYGARYYQPQISRWLSVDPLAEKYPGWSPYNYTADNPVVLVDPDGKKWVHPELAKKLSNKAKEKINDIKNDINKWQNKLLKKGLNEKRIRNLNKKITAAKNRIKALNETIKNIELLGKDTNLYDFESTKEQLHHVIKRDDGVIYIQGSNDALYVHEIAHVALYIKGNIELHFDSNGLLHSVYPYGAKDEIYAYGLQWGFDPHSVPFYINETGVPDIKKIANLVDDEGNYIYKELHNAFKDVKNKKNNRKNEKN